MKAITVVYNIQLIYAQGSIQVVAPHSMHGATLTGILKRYAERFTQAKIALLSANASLVIKRVQKVAKTAHSVAKLTAVARQAKTGFAFIRQSFGKGLRAFRHAVNSMTTDSFVLATYEAESGKYYYDLAQVADRQKCRRKSASTGYFMNLNTGTAIYL
jgi:hypothetical protein